jgi:hypothetical protein
LKAMDEVSQGVNARIVMHDADIVCRSSSLNKTI